LDPQAALAIASSNAAGASSLDVSVAMWAGLAGVVVAMLAIDFVLLGRRGAAPSMRASVLWSVAWLALALAFGAWMWGAQGSQAGSEYLAGYMLERSLSLDNVFVLAVLLGYFAVPAPVQGKVLGWTIALALVLRLGFILAGSFLIATLHVTFYAFGLLLLYTAYRLARHEGAEVEPERNPVLRLIRGRVPMTRDYHGSRLFVRDAGRRIATPLLAVLVAVATTDLLFAVDSIPAIFAVTTEPFIVFAANAFALLGLRALYFLLAGLVDRFAYLSAGLALILAFIGAKMLLVDVYQPPIWASLAAIVLILTTAITLSVLSTRRRRASEARLGPDRHPAGVPGG
jgi:tellurite resistance protein TerC